MQPQTQLQALALRPRQKRGTLTSLGFSLASSIEFANAIATVTAGTDGWHSLRGREDILSSTKVAAACGLDQYMSTKKLYRLRAKIDVEVFNDFSKAIMQKGNDEEAVIRRLLRRVVAKCDGDNAWIVSGEWCAFANKSACKWLTATPDGFLLHTHDARKQYNVELKRCERLVTEPRLMHCVQVLTQCICTGAKGALLFYVSPEQGYKLYRFDFNATAQRIWKHLLVPGCEEFLRALAAREEPPNTAGKKALNEDTACLFRECFTLIAEYNGEVYQRVESVTGERTYYCYV